MASDAIKSCIDPLGGLNTNPTDLPLRVTMGLEPGYSTVDKFGENPEIDTSTTPEDIWEGSRLYIYDADGTAPIERIVSNNAADTMEIEVQGLDINGDLVSQTKALTGTSPVVLDTPLWRIFRMSNVGNVSLTGVVYAYIGTTIPTAVPPASADAQTRAIINDGNNQTLMAIYTIPTGKVGFLYRGELGVSRAVTAAECRAAYYSRRFGKIFRVKKRVNISNSGTSIYQDSRSFPDVIPSLTDIRLSVESVSANNVGVFGTFDMMLVDEGKFSDEYLANIGQPGY